MTMEQRLIQARISDDCQNNHDHSELNFVQTFKYDAINRLDRKRKSLIRPHQPQIIDSDFDYDRFGNRIQFNQTVGGTTSTTTTTKPTIDSSNNRFTTGQGYQYDFNGNLIQDGRKNLYLWRKRQTNWSQRNKCPVGQPSIGEIFLWCQRCESQESNQLRNHHLRLWWWRSISGWVFNSNSTNKSNNFIYDNRPSRLASCDNR